MKRSRTSEALFIWLLKLQKSQCQDEGYILVIVMGMVLVLGGLFLTTGLTNKVNKASGKAIEENSTGFYAAEAGLNLRAQAIRDKFVGYNRPVGTPPTSWSACRDSSGNPATAGTLDFGCQAVDGKFNAILDKENATTLADKLKGIKVSTFVKEAASNPANVTVPANEEFAGLNAQEYRYDVTSVAYSNQIVAGQAPQPSAILTMSFKSRLVPLFQFAAFFENDMDLSRPATMTLNGPVHTNKNLYLNTSGDIKFYGQVSSAGNMYRGSKTDSDLCNPFTGSPATGTFSVHDPIKNGTAVADNLVTIPCRSTGRDLITADSTFNNVYVGGGTAVNDWNGRIRPNIPRLAVPDTSLLDTKLPEPAPSSKTYDYWNKADLRIALRLSNDAAQTPISIEVINADASKTTNIAATDALNSTCSPASTALSGTSALPASSNIITVADASGFSKGDALRIIRASDGIEDFDENFVINKAGNVLTLGRPLGKQLIPLPLSSVTVKKVVVWSSKTFNNYREKRGSTSSDAGSLIRMLNVDIRGLMTCAGSLMGGKAINETSDGGLVWHFTVLGPNSDVNVSSTPNSPNNYGVRIYNGATLASYNTADPSIQGLTVASDQAIYIRGNYNSNNKKPAAILADSLNILSENSPLDDSGSCTAYNNVDYNASSCSGTTTLSTTTRAASSTTINAAFLAGVDITGGANGPIVNAKYGGGLNNYPRLHENWSGNIFTYRGSMVSLGTALRVNGPFCDSGTTCNIYNPPTRNWDYDTDFNDAAKLPPLSPRSVFLRQERFSRDYEQQASRPLQFPLAFLFSGKLFSALPTFISSLFS